MPEVLKITGLHKHFADLHVLQGIDLTVAKGQTVVIIGGSGSGKSTLLRCVNFLELPTGGSISLNGQLVGQPRKGPGGEINIAYRERDLVRIRARVGMVFQQFNLFPHMTALRNVMVGVTTVLRRPEAEARRIALENLDRVGLTHKADEYPSRLSGGQQQRVAIARALAMQPELMLFDEATSALDPELVGEVLVTMRRLREEGVTMMIVTHELGFAYNVADHVILLHEGKVHEQGAPQQVLVNPRMQKTQEFLQSHSLFRASVDAATRRLRGEPGTAMNQRGRGPNIRISVEEIRQLSREALLDRGFSEFNAAAIADCVADAERDGAASHGLARIPGYLRGAMSGRIDARAKPRLRKRTSTHLVVEARQGFAAPAVVLARPEISAMAGRSGLVLASFRDSHHLHALWWDVEPLAEEGLVALAFVASRPVMATFGGKARALGTNPLALSVPRAGAPPLTIDMAASAVARGEIGLAARASRKIPLGWALDAEGRPTDDPHHALAGTQLTFSDSPKASALALTVELLAVGLSGGAFGFEAARESTSDNDGGPLRTGSAILAFDVSKLGTSHFAERVADLANQILATGAERIPGDRRHDGRSARLRDGVEVSRLLVEEIERLRVGRRAMADLN